MYFNNAGFESICEAMYLGKPIVMNPRHIEQECHAYNAVNIGAGIISESFDIKKILDYQERYKMNREFVYWVRSSERQILYEIEKTTNHDIYSGITDYSKCMVG